MQLMRRDLLKGLVCLPAAAFLRISPANAAGQFVGQVITRWSDDGRAMILTEPFEYVDANGKQWPVPKGTTVDGASIPRPFWSVIGGPFEGKYRNASVVHDFYCQVRTRPHLDVHNVFHEAMLTSGVPTRTGWLMFQAVNNFGPRWAEPKVDPKCEVVDDNYDFAACARNLRVPSLRRQEVSRGQIEDFIAEVEGEADPRDIRKLREGLDEMR